MTTIMARLESFEIRRRHIWSSGASLINSSKYEVFCLVGNEEHKKNEQVTAEEDFDWLISCQKLWLLMTKGDLTPIHIDDHLEERLMHRLEAFRWLWLINTQASSPHAMAYAVLFSNHPQPSNAKGG